MEGKVAIHVTKKYISEQNSETPGPMRSPLKHPILPTAYSTHFSSTSSLKYAVPALAAAVGCALVHPWHQPSTHPYSNNKMLDTSCPCFQRLSAGTKNTTLTDW